MDTTSLQHDESSVSARRAMALEEAELVLSSCEYAKNRQALENFNLLSVVTNPNGNRTLPMAEATRIKPMTNSKTSEATFLSSFTTSLSKEIETINATIQSYSRTYLGNNFLISDESDYLYDMDYYLNWEYDNDYTPNLSPNTSDFDDLTQVEAYLRTCGSMAAKFDSTNLECNDASDVTSNRFITVNEELYDSIQPSLLISVPDIFFQEDFNLSDPKTFETLLLRNYPPHFSRHRGDEDRYPPVSLQELEAYTQYLDTIEMTLLRKVRYHAEAFFQESDRFSSLKSLVDESISDVRSLRSQLNKTHDRTVVDIGSIPFMDILRQHMRTLVGLFEDIASVLDVKSCVGGLIAAGDYLGAVEAVNIAKSLLNGEETSQESLRKQEDSVKLVENCLVLKKITALGRIFQELSQYEDVVVLDLCHQLVDIFLNWGQGDVFNDIGMYRINASVDETRHKTKSLLVALQTSGKMLHVTELYREKLCNIIRVTLRTIGREYASDVVKHHKMKLQGKKIPWNTFLDQLDFTSDNFNASTSEFLSLLTTSQFLEFVTMIFEQVITYIESGVAVNKYFREEGISLAIDSSIMPAAVLGGDNPIMDEVSLIPSQTTVLDSVTDVAVKSISEILRVRKETNMPSNDDDMKRLWDSCLQFIQKLENLSSRKCYSLRSSLLGLVKSFIEQKHESNLASLASTLEGDNWNQCDVSSDRQADILRLCTGRAILTSKFSSSAIHSGGLVSESTAFAVVEGKQFRLVWSCLILVEMIIQYIDYAAQFQALATSVTGKISELLRLFNTRTMKLILGAGAIHGAARLKSINAKHLALVMQCLHMISTLLPHVRAALMAQLPNKQHSLLMDLDTIKKDYTEHIDKVMSKFVSIIGGIVEHGLASSLLSTDFDERFTKRQAEVLTVDMCCPFLSGIALNTRKMHQVLSSLMPPEDLVDVFSRIFVYLDSKIPTILISYDSDQSKSFSLPIVSGGINQLIDEIKTICYVLNELPGTHPWDFSAGDVLKRRLGLSSSNEPSYSSFKLLIDETMERNDSDVENTPRNERQGDEIATEIPRDENVKIDGQNELINREDFSDNASIQENENHIRTGTQLVELSEEIKL